MITRDTIYKAFFNQAVAAALASSAGLVTYGRRFRFWTDVPPEMQPALFQVQRDEDPSGARGQPVRWKLKPRLFVYVNVGEDPSAEQAPALNAIVDAIEAAFPQNPQTGARTVNVAWEPSGAGAYQLEWESVEYFEDVVGSGGQAIAVMDAVITAA